jgi:hypothetical protein
VVFKFRAIKGYGIVKFLLHVLVLKSDKPQNYLSDSTAIFGTGSGILPAYQHMYPHLELIRSGEGERRREPQGSVRVARGRTNKTGQVNRLLTGFFSFSMYGEEGNSGRDW